MTCGMSLPRFYVVSDELFIRLPVGRRDWGNFRRFPWRESSEFSSSYFFGHCAQFCVFCRT